MPHAVCCHKPGSLPGAQHSSQREAGVLLLPLPPSPPDTDTEVQRDEVVCTEAGDTGGWSPHGKRPLGASSTHLAVR